MGVENDLCFPQQATLNGPTSNPTTEATQRRAGPNYFRDDENVQFMWLEAIVDHKLVQNNVLRLTVRTHLQINRTAQTHDSVMHQFIDQEREGDFVFAEISFFTPTIFRVKFSSDRDVISDWTDEPKFPGPEARMLVGRQHAVNVECQATEKHITFATQQVTLEIQKEPFHIRAFRHGERAPFWQQRRSDLFTSDVVPSSIAKHGGRTATFEAFTINPGENLYGLGERFDSVPRNGRFVDFVNHDAIGTSNTRSYINVPFFWSTSGYGCFVNSIARTEFDLASSEQGTAGFCTEENFMDYFIIHGSYPHDILRQYTTDLTGTAPVLPNWTFGLWLSRNSYESWDVVDEVLKKAHEHKIPVDDIHLDTSWFKEDWNPDLIFDKIRFRDHEAKMKQLKSEGVHVSLWQYSFAPPREDNSLFVEGREHGYFGMQRTADGSRGKEFFSYPPGTDGWKVDDVVIDYSNSEARAWYGQKISSLIRQGASAIKTDFGDCIPPDAWYANIEGSRFQNLFSLVYNATIWRAIKSVDADSAIWARSGTAGSQRYPVHWGGDSQCSWSALQGTLKATLSMGLSGFTYFSHDIGGFIGKPSSELYVRWAQLGLLGASHSRSHGAGNDNSREPWSFGDEALTVFRKFVDLRYRLLPYIVQQGRDGAARGLPLVRHLILDWPKDRNVWAIENQYLLGDSFLVAPVLMPACDMGETMDVYFPQGTWYDYSSREKYLTTKGEWRAVKTPTLDEMAIWVREGSMICYAGEGRQRTWNKAGGVVLVELYGQVQRGCRSVDRWVSQDGDGGRVVAQRHPDGSWHCPGDATIKVDHFDG